MVGTPTEGESPKRQGETQDMAEKLRYKFLASDYGQRLFKEFQNLRQREKSVSEYTNEFFRLSIHRNVDEGGKQLVARYVNGLNYAIQDEIMMHYVRNVEEAYQLALKVEEKLARNSRKRPFVGGAVT